MPPLAVVGLGLAEREWTDAWGAMLLFLTNFVSILLAGGGTFAFLRLSAASTRGLVGPARRRVFVLIAIGALLLAIPLGSTSYTVARESLAEMRTREFVQEWLSETGFELTRITVRGKQIEVTINGDGVLPPLPDLGTNLQKTIHPNVQLRLKVVPSRHISYPELAAE